MASVNASIDIAADPEQTWSVLSDPARFSSWVANHQGFVGEPPTAFTPGGSFGQRLRVMGMPADVRWTVDGFEAPRSVVLSGTGPMGIGLKAAYDVAPVDGGSRVDVRYDFSGAAVFAVAGQLEREVGEVLTTSLGTLKTLVESQG